MHLAENARPNITKARTATSEQGSHQKPRHTQPETNKELHRSIAPGQVRSGNPPKLQQHFESEWARTFSMKAKQSNDKSVYPWKHGNTAGHPKHCHGRTIGGWVTKDSHTATKGAMRMPPSRPFSLHSTHVDSGCNPTRCARVDVHTRGHLRYQAGCTVMHMQKVTL